MQPNYLLRHLLIGIVSLSLVAWPPTARGDDIRKLETVYDMYAGYKVESFPEVADIAPQAAMALMNTREVVFVDAREAAEMKVSMLPGAITKEEFLAQPTAYQGKTAIAYCTISYRSGVFARKMARKGISVYNLSGGLLAWVLEGGKVYDNRGETRRIHVYGEEWSYPPEGYETVTFKFLHRLFN